MKATFEADFSTFRAEVDSSVAKLETLDAEAAKVSRSLSTMDTTVGRMKNSFSQFNSVMSTAGISIAQPAGALEELTAAAGKTVGELGALSTAGLVTGTAIASWNLGRAIADLLGTDEAIAHLTGSLQALKNEVAGAQVDTIARAIAAGAPAAIDYAGAVAYLTKQMKDARKAQQDYERGVKAITEAGEDWGQTLTTINGATVEAIKGYLASGVAQHDLAAAYGLTAAQVRAVAEARKLDIATMQLQQQMDKETFALAMEHQKQWREEIDKTLKERNASVVAGLGAIKDAEQKLFDFYAQSSLSSTDFQIKQITDWVRAQEAAFEGTIEQRKEFNRLVEELATQQIEKLKAKEKQMIADAAEAARLAMNELIGVIPDIGHGPETPTPWSTLTPAPIAVKPIGVSYRDQPPPTTTVNMQVSGVIDTGSEAALTAWLTKLLRNARGQLPNA